MKTKRYISKTIPLLVLALILCACSATPLAGMGSGEQPTLMPKLHATPDVLASESKLYATLDAPASLAIGEPVEITFTLMNKSDTPLYFLKWYTPLEGIGGEIFKVTRDGQAVPYEGILAYRSSPTPDAYVLLNPGESTSAVVNLGTSFNLSKPGTYKIRFISPRISHIAFTDEEIAKSLDDLGPVQISSNTVTLEVVD